MTWPWVVANVVEWLFILVLGLVLLGLVRRVSEFLEGAESRLRTAGASLPSGFGGLEPGTVVGDFELLDSDGSIVDSHDLLRASTLLLFMDPGCEPCEDLARLLDGTPEIEGVPLVVVTAAASDAAGLPLPRSIRMLRQDGKSVSQVFDNVAAPQAFAMRGRIVLGKGIPESMTDLRRLARLVGGGGEVSELSGAAR